MLPAFHHVVVVVVVGVSQRGHQVEVQPVEHEVVRIALLIDVLTPVLIAAFLSKVLGRRKC